MSGGDAWPALPLPDWAGTYLGLHLRAQAVGKTRLALAPPQNHCWHTALYLTARGLTTSPIPAGRRSFEVELDLLGHGLHIRTSDGESGSVELRPQPMADFWSAYSHRLRDLELEAAIAGFPVPVEMAEAVPFTADHLARPYDRAAVERLFHLLTQADRVLKQFRGRFVGKASPVHFWWGAFDLACTRFSGARAPLHPGGVPHLPDRVVQEAYSHACISAGWWPGSPGVLDEPAFYAYAYPEPAGFPSAAVPRPAYYHPGLKEFILPYDAVRSAADPDAALLGFLQATYEAAADRAGWDRGALEA